LKKRSKKLLLCWAMGAGPTNAIVGWGALPHPTIPVLFGHKSRDQLMLKADIAQRWVGAA
jgi:hypothetical protein